MVCPDTSIPPHVHGEVIVLGKDHLRSTIPPGKGEKLADSQSGRQADGQADIDRQLGRQIDRQTDSEADRQSDRQSVRQPDRQTNRQAERLILKLADRQKTREKCCDNQIQTGEAMIDNTATKTQPRYFASRMRNRLLSQNISSRHIPQQEIIKQNQ